MSKFSIKDNLILIGHLVHEEILVDLIKEKFPDLVSILVLSHWVEHIFVPSVEGVEFIIHSCLGVFNYSKLGGIIGDLAILHKFDDHLSILCVLENVVESKVFPWGESKVYLSFEGIVRRSLGNFPDIGEWSLGGINLEMAELLSSKDIIRFVGELVEEVVLVLLVIEVLLCLLKGGSAFNGVGHVLAVPFVDGRVLRHESFASLSSCPCVGIISSYSSGTLSFQVRLSSLGDFKHIVESWVQCFNGQINLSLDSTSRDELNNENLLGRKSIKVNLSLSFLLLHGETWPVHKGVGGSILELVWDNTSNFSISSKFDKGVDIISVLDVNFSFFEILIQDQQDSKRSIDISCNLNSILARRIKGHNKIEGLARDGDPHIGSPGSFGNGGNNSVSNTILEEVDGDALSGDPGDGHLPGVIMVKGGFSNKVIEIVAFQVDLKKLLGIAVQLNVGLEHTILHLSVHGDGSLLWTISKECELLDELVVKFHLKETINSLTTLEVKFKLDIVKAGRFDKPMGGELHQDMASLDGVGGVDILQFEAEAESFHVKLLVPVTGAPLHSHAHGGSQRLGIHKEILNLVHKLVRNSSAMSVGDASQEKRHH